MYKSLSPGAIRVRTNGLGDLLRAAQIGGFGGVEFDADEVAGLVESEGADAVRARFAGAGVRPAGWSLADGWRESEEAWRRQMGEVPRLARAAAAVGGTGCITWISPASDERTFEENYRFHVARLTPVARVLADHGGALGLEFIGPKTLRDGHAHPFVHTMEGMLAMAAEIGPNVGLLLDCWHWYTSHGTLDALRALRPAQVVHVHVNDAPAGVPVDEQRDDVRALPGETGVIDIAGFLQALRQIGYDGPVTPEPFKRGLADLPSDEARLRAVGAAMDAVFQKAGLSGGGPI